MNEQKAQFGLAALLATVGCFAAVFALAKSASVLSRLLLIAVTWFALLMACGLVARLLANHNRPWSNRILPYWILLSLALAVSGPLLIVVAMVYLRLLG